MTPSNQTGQSSSLFPTLAEALQHELDALAQSPHAIVLLSGERVGTFAGFQYYRFEIPEHCSLQYITRLQFAVGTNEPFTCDGIIVAQENQYLIAALPYDFGPVLPETSCFWDVASSLVP